MNDCNEDMSTEASKGVKWKTLYHPRLLRYDLVPPFVRVNVWRWRPTRQHCTKIRREEQGQLGAICTSEVGKNILFHLFRNLLVYGVTKVLYAAFAPTEHDRLGIIWGKAPWFCIDTDKVQGFPHLLDQFINVEPFTGGYGDRVRDFVPIEDIEHAETWREG